MFSKFVQSIHSEADPGKIIALAKAKNLLHTNSEEGDLTKTLKLGKKDNDPSKAFVARCYLFDIEDTKNILSIKNTKKAMDGNFE